MLLRALKAAWRGRWQRVACAPARAAAAPTAGAEQPAPVAARSDECAPAAHRRVDYLSLIPGVIHVGANIGQEREIYDRFGLSVVWIEPITEVFEVLQANIQAYPRQRALQHLVTDRDGAAYAFHIADNDGLSSSILDLAEHRVVWPEVAYRDSVMLRSITLKSLLEREALDPDRYPALVLDTQGTELMVLRGAGDWITRFRFIQVEVADFEAYAGCCRLTDMDAFVHAHGFVQVYRVEFAEQRGVGSYFDVLYERRGAESQLQAQAQ